MDWLDEAQVYTSLEICGALDSQSKAKQDFIGTSRKRASIQKKRTSGHGFQAVKQAPGAGYKVNDVIEITVSVPSAHLTLTDQINLKDNEKHCGNYLVSTQTDKIVSSIANAVTHRAPTATFTTVCIPLVVTEVGGRNGGELQDAEVDAEFRKQHPVWSIWLDAGQEMSVQSRP